MVASGRRRRGAEGRGALWSVVTVATSDKLRHWGERCGRGRARFGDFVGGERCAVVVVEIGRAHV